MNFYIYNCKYKMNTKTNMLFKQYPELLKSSLTKNQPSVDSEDKIKLKCEACKDILNISPKELLKNPCCVCGNWYIQSKLSLKNLTNIVYNYINTSETYCEFDEKIKKLPISFRGDSQEIFATIYFNSHKKHYNIQRYYARILENEMPCVVNDKDLGTDGVILHEDGTYSLVQIKFRSVSTSSLQRECLGGMSLEALPLACEKLFKYLYLFSNTVSPPKSIGKFENKYVKYIMNDTLINCNWDIIKEAIKSGEVEEKYEISIPKIKLRIWQKNALKFIGKKSFGRKSIVSACGTGKSIMGNSLVNYRHRINKSYMYNRVLIVVPNLHLLSQWFENMACWEPKRDYLLIGSDIDVNEQCIVPFYLTTRVDDIKEFNEKEHTHGSVIISTFHSLNRVFESKPTFSITLVDEAHLCCSKKDNMFSVVAKPDFPSENILYMTATPKVYSGTLSETVVSMNDEEIFGKRFTYSFKQAIEDGIISDYKIILGLGKHEEKYENFDFNAKFLYESIIKYKLNSVIVYSSTHEKSKKLYESFDKYEMYYKKILMPVNATSYDKAKVVSMINSGIKIIVFNVKVFSLGSDIPCLQSVMIVGDRTSVCDVVQTMSRCLRKHKDKNVGYILVPCLINEGFEEKGDYYNVRKILSSIGSVDSCLLEDIVLRQKSRNSKIVYNYIDICDEKIEKDVDFELILFDRLCNSLAFSPHYRFHLLMEFCRDNERLPSYDELYKDIKIGWFLDLLLRGKNYPEFKEEWMVKLKGVSVDIERLIEDKIQLRTSEEAIKRKNIETKQRFQALYDYCKEHNILPISLCVYKEIQIGKFLAKLLGGARFKDIRNEWIDKLKSISENIRQLLEKRLENINNEDRKKQRAIPVEKKFELLHEFSVENDRLPKRCEIYKTQRLEVLLNGLLGGKKYLTSRDGYLERLKNISPNVKKQVEDRLNNINDEEKKTSRDIKPIDRFIAFLDYCRIHDKLPRHVEVHNNIKIGVFLCHLLKGDRYKDERDEWLEQAKAISPNIKQELERRAK
jgi:superfamily II DNA or RNA helicase